MSETDREIAERVKAAAQDTHPSAIEYRDSLVAAGREAGEQTALRDIVNELGFHMTGGGGGGYTLEHLRKRYLDRLKDRTT